MQVIGRLRTMYKKMLGQFLEKNRPDSEMPTAAMLAHFNLKAFVAPESDDTRKAFEGLCEMTMPERIEEAAAEKAEIEKVSEGSELVRIMRRKFDSLNQQAVISKAMELESDVVPDVLRRYRNNRVDEFIEIATQVLCKTKLDIAETIIGYYDEMPNPYGQSMALVLLGFKAEESRIPWLILKYHELKRSYPRESFHEGAWYGLLEMNERFYGE